MLSNSLNIQPVVTEASSSSSSSDGAPPLQVSLCQEDIERFKFAEIVPLHTKHSDVLVFCTELLMKVSYF